MKYKVLKDGMAKDGRSYTEGTVVELDQDYAEHLVVRGIVSPLNSGKGKGKDKQRAVSKPADLEQAVEEE